VRPWHETMSQVASHGLPNIFPSCGPVTRLVLFADFSSDPVVPSSDAWRSEWKTVVSHGLAGVASRIISERSLQVPEEIRERLNLAQFRGMAATQTVVQESRVGVDALHAAGISFVVTKGPGTALAGTRLSDRPFGDLDVVVEPARFAEARRALAKLGYFERQQTKQTWDVFNLYCREAINLRTAAGGSVDLHHTIPPWYWSDGLKFDVLVAGRHSRDVLGVRLPLPAYEHNLLVTALHVVSDKSRPGQTLRIWRDILVLARKCPVDVLVDTAMGTGLAGWLVWILGCLPDEVQPAELVESLRACQPQLRGNRRLRMLLPPRSGAKHLIGRVLSLPVSHGALFAAGLAVPSASYLRGRYPDAKHPYVSWWCDAPRNFVREGWSR
jgi:hypothetical protein